ncbi:unnamed protein product [Penicillium roqueforti FM164]|uniref:Genomic scaffold, ProqFM164S02 n=1 Tax=Penicillium roqueforti (strain FM164) TaxID=1365484 RepID=W6Q1Z2_PENRF|nr:unnamed protein product [Penicillium roqueforti FM164]
MAVCRADWIDTSRTNALSLASRVGNLYIIYGGSISAGISASEPQVSRSK